MSITQAQRDAQMSAAAEATIDALHHEMTVATELAAEFVREHCPHATTIWYTPSDQGDWYHAHAIDCPTHGDDCPASHALDTDPNQAYGHNLYTDHMGCALAQLSCVSEHTTIRWRLDLTTN